MVSLINLHTIRAYMLRKRYINSILNPVIGFFPFMLYAILHAVMDKEQSALLLSLASCIVGELIFNIFLKTRILGISFIICGLAILLTTFIWMIGQNYIIYTNFYIIICEIFIVFFCKSISICKKYITFYTLKKKNLKQRPFLNRVYFAISIIQPIFIIHLLCALSCRFLFYPDNQFYDTINLIIYSIFPAFNVVFTLIIYESVRIKAFEPRFKKEEWLPIVSDKGEVTGKIAKSVSINMKNRYMHPVVRVALICKQQIYLQKREHDDSFNPDKFDYPFEKFVLFNHQINIAVNNSIAQVMNCDPQDFEFSFLLKYVFNNENTKRLIFLFVLEIDSEDLLPNNHKLNGKFWSIKQIEDSFSDNIFCDCFELEYEYVKNKVLLKDRNAG